MSHIVFIEKPNKPKPMYLHLIGNYAVRLFASLDSFRTLYHWQETLRPSLICIDCDDLNAQPQQIDSELLKWNISCKRVYLSTKPLQGSSHDFECFYQTTDDPLLLLKIVQNNLGSNCDQYRDLVLDRNNHMCAITTTGESVELTPKEFRLLSLLIEHSGGYISRKKILEKVWNKVNITDRTFNSQVSRLRKRIENSSTRIESKYGVGYGLL